jgi:transcriptional regulator with XRE-family HTH domain
MMVGHLVKRARKAKGLSQTRLATLVGSSQRYISRLENDQEQSLPRRATRDRFGEVLGITESEWLRAYGAIDAAGDASNGPRVVRIITRRGELEIDLDQAVAFVEAKPDPDHQAMIARWQDGMARPDYERVILRLYLAWDSNEDAVRETVETLRPDLAPGA